MSKDEIEGMINKAGMFETVRNHLGKMLVDMRERPNKWDMNRIKLELEMLAEVMKNV